MRERDRQTDVRPALSKVRHWKVWRHTYTCLKDLITEMFSSLSHSCTLSLPLLRGAASIHWKEMMYYETQCRRKKNGGQKSMCVCVWSARTDWLIAVSVSLTSPPPPPPHPLQERKRKKTGLQLHLLCIAVSASRGICQRMTAVLFSFQRCVGPALTDCVWYSHH